MLPLQIWQVVAAMSCEPPSKIHYRLSLVVQHVAVEVSEVPYKYVIEYIMQKPALPKPS